MISARPISLLIPLIISLQGCGDGSGNSLAEREPEGPRSRGPQVDRESMRNDPIIVAFESESADYRRILDELRTLDSKMVDGGLSESDQTRWTELRAEAATERRRLNSMIYAADVDREQRAAMWWCMQPESSNPKND